MKTSLILLCLSASAPELTFHKHDLPILQNHCQGCHRPGEAAPMPQLETPVLLPKGT